MLNSVIVIGDVHGCYKSLLALIEKLPKGILIVISGDLVDRGPRSMEVVQYCIDNNISVTKGNHEVMMLDYFNSKEDIWTYNGGYETLRSYGAKITEDGDHGLNISMTDESRDVLNKHLEWIKNLPTYLEFENVVNFEGRRLVVSHSSIHKVWRYKDEPARKALFDTTITWNRDIINSGIRDIPDVYNIFGHTPIESNPRVRKPFAMVDTGCVYSKEKGLGVLTALQYPEIVVYQQENIDV